ncbi:glycosyltransferase family 2 protein [Dyadobacter arcticus]|uniref:Glycosyltransferase involved in cell wall biosynthesis n=1 Tax=Dyadobacter arcticus TaxID=1078754 RepID=A0ABX0UI82_9BACT|nr:glycosyltransferase [Dyadobacter arcticus]NIJ52727.1 glycosyltransferase involved in cell wall biosynthesis [Dyadobacter arcticus]
MTVNISIVIPTYRRPALLQKCLHAIIRQDNPGCSYQVIVVSDGPDPATNSLITQVKQENPGFLISFHSLETKRGPAAARNFGWKQSNAELIAFTDDDCIPSASWLKAYWYTYQFTKKTMIAFTGRVEVPVPEKPTDYEKNVSHLSTAEFITANCACTRAALEWVNGFDEAFPIAWREDSDLQFRLLEKQIPIIQVQEALVCHPVRKTSWGSSIRDQQKSMFNALLFKKHPEFYRKRIANGPVWNYYTTILSSVIAVFAFVVHANLIAGIAMLIWLASVVSFAVRRLKGTNASFSHRLEMIVTSVLIPYLSVYWTLRGAMRYKVFFL